MEQQRSHTFSKAERLCSKKLIERLFGGEGKSFPAFPLRVVYMPLTEEEMAAHVSILVSVPKKRFKRAVKRNRVKRQVREAYRRNKHILTEALAAQEGAPRIALAFIWLDGKLHPSVEVEQKVKKLLHHIVEDHR